MEIIILMLIFAFILGMYAQFYMAKAIDKIFKSDPKPGDLDGMRGWK